MFTFYVFIGLITNGLVALSTLATQLRNIFKTMIFTNLAAYIVINGYVKKSQTAI